MKELIERLKERIALHNLNSLHKGVRYCLGPGKFYEFRWMRLKHTDRERVIYSSVRLLEAGRPLTDAEQDSLWRLVAKVYHDHAVQLACGFDRIRIHMLADIEDEFDAETDRLRDKLKALIPYTPWFQDFLAARGAAV